MSNSVGYRSLTVRDHASDLAFPLIVLYPSPAPAVTTAFGPYSMDVAAEGPIQTGSFPLVVISHGSHSSPLVHRTLACDLAKHGYVVLLPEHVGDNRSNASLEGTLDNLRHRPRHISLSIDAVAADPFYKDYVESKKVAVIGHSLGGYAALALAGGEPWWSPDQKVEVKTDTRVHALVLMAPATCWFVPNEALRNVRKPILMLTAEHDPITRRWQAQLLLDNVPERSQVTWQIIRNAGHLSFLSPFPPAMQSPDFPPAMDPEGFDRQSFHDQMNDDIHFFLNAAIKGL